MVKYAAKYKNPRLLESGMNCFLGILRGPHLVAHTWASNPTLKFWPSPMAEASFCVSVGALYHEKHLASIGSMGLRQNNSDRTIKKSPPKSNLSCVTQVRTPLSEITSTGEIEQLFRLN